MKQRIEWLAVLRGLNILLVVMVHVQLVDMSTGQNHAFCNASHKYHSIDSSQRIVSCVLYTELYC